MIINMEGKAVITVKDNKSNKPEATEKILNAPEAETEAAAESTEKAVAESDASNKRVPFAIVESYKNLRTSIAFLLSENDGSSFTITSANAGEGKSTTSANLAVAFSQLGKKVLIIDADLRRASLHKKFKLENDIGLSDVITGTKNANEAIKVINPMLSILTAGPLPLNPSELLDSQSFSDLMVYLNSTYDFVVVDTPPLNVVSDALIVAPNTTGMILVIRDGYTPHYSIKKAFEVMRFSNVNILGTIMNGTNPRSKSRYIYRKSKYYSYNSGYRSSYGSNYGYGGYTYGGGYGGGYGSYGHGGGYGYGPRQQENSNNENRQNNQNNQN